MNTEKFCKYFFYGLENQEEVLKELINQVAILQKDSLYEEESQVIDNNVRKKIEENKWEINKLKEEIEQSKKRLSELTDEKEIENEKIKIYKSEVRLQAKKTAIRNSAERDPILFNRQVEEVAKLLMQLRRFVTLNDDQKNKQYIFNDEKELEQSKKEVKEYLKLHFSNSEDNIFHIYYAPMSGIFYKNEKEKPEQWVQEVIDILKELQKLQKNNLFQYYSTYMDVKYARAINRMKTNVTQDYEEKDAIKNVYTMFLKRQTNIRNRH